MDVVSFVRQRHPWPFETVQEMIAAAGDRIVPLRGAADRAPLILGWNGAPSGFRRTAAATRARGGKVVVMENGYLRRSPRGEPLFLLERDGYNGRGWVPRERPDRNIDLGLKVRSKSYGRSFVLIVGQIGGRWSDLTEPPGWLPDVVQRIRARSRKTVAWLPHPESRIGGVDGILCLPRSTRLDEVIGDAHCVVTWASTRASLAALHGVPLIYEGPSHITAETVGIRGLPDEIDALPPLSRDAVERFAEDLRWRLWTDSELRTGGPWRFITERL